MNGKMLFLIVVALPVLCVSCGLLRKSAAKKPPAQVGAAESVAAPGAPRAQGLRREERLPVGERKGYTYRFFGTGEVQQEIDSRPEIEKREQYQAVITFWIQGARGEGSLRLLCNGKPVQDWEELEKLLSDFRISLITQKCIRHAEVVIDQIGEVPLKVVDDILTVCFRAGIKEIKMSSTEPQKEQ